MKNLLIASMLLTLTCQVHADWARTAMNSLIVVDWLQTRSITSNPNFVEANPLLGRNPTRKQVDAFFITNLVVYNYVGEKHMGRHKNAFYGVIGAMRLLTVVHNKKIGVKINF